MSNHRRLLAEVLAIDAWHDPIRTTSQSSVYVELSFQKGRLGGDDKAFPFTFDISLRRALLTVKVTDPFKIDRKTVARSFEESSAEFTNILTTSDGAKRSASAGIGFSPSKLTASAHAAASIGHQTNDKRELRKVQKLPRIIASPIPKGAREYAWELQPGFEDALAGHPWNGAEKPRFSLLPLSGLDHSNGSIKAEISCKLDDIIIDNLELKDASAKAIFSELINNRMNEAAAIQHLKKVLKDLTLETGAFDDRFSNLLIAEIIALEG